MGGGTVGVLWTDDRDGVGLVGTPTTDPVLLQAGWAAIRAGAAAGVAAGDQFEHLAALFPGGVVRRGELGVLRLRPAL